MKDIHFTFFEADFAEQAASVGKSGLLQSLYDIELTLVKNRLCLHPSNGTMSSIIHILLLKGDQLKGEYYFSITNRRLIRFVYVPLRIKPTSSLF